MSDKAMTAKEVGTLYELRAKFGDEVMVLSNGNRHILKPAGEDGKLWGGKGDTLIRPDGKFQMIKRKKV